MQINASMCGYKIDVYYTYKDYGARNIYGYWNEHQVSSVSYGINEGKLIISDISNDAKFVYDGSINHFGTEILNELLIRLKGLNQTFECINGGLSLTDAINKNWLTSIKFYDDFCKWSDTSLEYRLKFHLYNEDEKINKVSLPTDVNERERFIRAFTDEHIKANQGAVLLTNLYEQSHRWKTTCGFVILGIP